MQSTRLVAGVSDDDFSWTLEPGGQFAAPEVLFSYSDAGLSELSARYHHFLQHNIIRSVWRDKPRPILINNWEATYMDFDGQRILDIARQARELGGRDAGAGRRLVRPAQRRHQRPGRLAGEREHAI